MSKTKRDPLQDSDELTPREIVEELDKYIIGQNDAKKAVAVAIRNRYRRRLVSEDLREEIYPKNIIMIGPTGCGKTEIARRLSRLTGAPFVKVEATKYTEVGYVGRDVESMIRELVNTSVNMVRKEFRKSVELRARDNAEERLLDLLLPSSRDVSQEDEPQENPMQNLMRAFGDMSSGTPLNSSGQNFENIAENPAENMSSLGKDVREGMHGGDAKEQKPDEDELRRRRNARDGMRRKLQDGDLEDREVELELQSQAMPMVQVMSGNNMEEIDMQVQNMLGDIMPRKSKKKRMTVAEAREAILEEETERLVDPDRVQQEALRRAEQMGIVFLDELDKICGRGSMQSSGPDVSREGVQRDLLPIVEGAAVNTRHGTIKTDHILFIAAGAFHLSKPSDLIPELQGRFPIRVELQKLTVEDFRRILSGPRNSLTRQAVALLGTENLDIEFTDDALDEISRLAFEVNERTENIGARRLHTIMERLLEDLSFKAPDLKEDERHIRIDCAFVQDRLAAIAKDQDLSQYIL